MPITRATSDRRRILLAVLILVSLNLPGCTPARYRLRADRETYNILASKGRDPRWQPPSFSVAPSPASRNFDPHDPDRPPMPPDDPAAHQYMHCVDGKPGYQCWHCDGDTLTIESPQWRQFLETFEPGSVRLDPERAVELAVRNSREYQFELERLYLTALSLTLERFEFDTQWFAFSAPFFRHFGTSSTPGDDGQGGNESNTLTLDSALGFTRSFASGGQLLVDFANTFLWEFAGPDTNVTFSNFSFQFVQPLLRRFGREVRLEDLTQAERVVLYAIRGFARFRKDFYFNLVSGDGGYLSLLLQLQSVRNLESNVASLEQNLRTHEALSVAGIVSPLQVDQVFQDYQAGKLRLIQARNSLQNALDSFKIRLGVPPELEVQLDDAQLEPFELNSSEIISLQSQLDELLAAFRELDEPPTREELAAGFDELRDLSRQSLAEWESITNELGRWRLDTGTEKELDEEQRERERAARRQITRRLSELATDLEQSQRDISTAAEAVLDQDPTEAWKQIQDFARVASSHVADLFVLQTQIRANLIELEPLNWEVTEAIDFALENRLDLMNQRAAVVDAWRKIRVAADALEADLDVIVEGDVATDPDANNPVKFSAEASSYRVGARLDGPLNRRAERNFYRRRLVEYQRARRDFLARRDVIVQAIRRRMRDLRADQLNFEITRQSLLTAARQVELARVQLLAPGQAGDSSTTQDVLRALDSLLASKNAFISIWVAYETDRLQLLLDTEALQLDEDGLAREFSFDVSTTPNATSTPAAPPTPTDSPAPAPLPEPAATPDLSG